MTLLGSHLLSYWCLFNMVPRHVEPHSILRSSSVSFSPPHLVSFCHFLLHNSEDSASWAGMSVWSNGSPAQICSIEKESCVSCMIGVGDEQLLASAKYHLGWRWSTAYCFFFPVAFMTQNWIILMTRRDISTCLWLKQGILREKIVLLKLPQSPQQMERTGESSLFLRWTPGYLYLPPSLYPKPWSLPLEIDHHLL